MDHTEQKGRAMTLKEYRVGELTYQLSEVDAQRLGGKPINRAQAKAKGRAPKNKAADPQGNKSDDPKDQSGADPQGNKA